VHESQDRGAVFLEAAPRLEEPGRSPLDPADCVEAALARDVGRLGGPGRDRAWAWHDEQHRTAAGRRGIAILEQALEHQGFPRVESPRGLDKMPVLGTGGPDRSVHRCEAGVELFEPERGNGAAAA
jgi:hypothetical protein